jgi:hypothetical protein
MMSLGVAVLFEILMVVVATAPAGVVLGVVELGPVELLDPLPPHDEAARTAAAQAASSQALLCFVIGLIIPH